jgi:hypothetical protein
MIAMMESLLDRFRQRPRNAPGTYKLLSFLIFLSLNVTAILSSSTFLWLFGVLVVIDLLGTLMLPDPVVSADRAFFFFTVTVISIVDNPSGPFLLTPVVLGLLAALDFSLLLRKLDGSRVEVAVLTNRLRSYALTILPAFLLSYLFLYLYSFNLQLGAMEALILFGLTMAGAFIAIYIIARYLLSLGKNKYPVLR